MSESDPGPASEDSPERKAAEYLMTVLEKLAAVRPELFTAQKGRWKGPAADPKVPQGLWFFGGPMRVCISPWHVAGETPESEPSLWLHLSVSINGRTPTYEELSEIRGRFFRPDDVVVHVWPKADEHFSLHDTCLHLWARIDGVRTLPDLRGLGGGV